MTMKEIRFFYVPEAGKVQELPTEEATLKPYAIESANRDKCLIYERKN